MNCNNLRIARYMRGESNPNSIAYISTGDTESTEGATPRKLSGKRTLSCEQSGKWHGSAHRWTAGRTQPNKPWKSHWIWAAPIGAPSLYAVKICKVSSRVAGRTDAASWRIRAALSGANCPSFKCMLFSNPTRQWPPAATAAIITSYSL